MKKDNQVLIGRRLKEIRKEKGISLVALAEKSGVQIATLSRIQNNKMTGTIETHMDIAKALGVVFTQLYTDYAEDSTGAESKSPTQTAELTTHNEESSYKILVEKVLKKKMMPILVKIEPEGTTSLEENEYGTEKFVYLLEGELEIKVGEKVFLLAQGSTIYFDSFIEHQFINKSKSPVKLITVTSPVSL